jgi:hypothetical protein
MSGDPLRLMPLRLQNLRADFDFDACPRSIERAKTKVQNPAPRKKRSLMVPVSGCTTWLA